MSPQHAIRRLALAVPLCGVVAALGATSAQAVNLPPSTVSTTLYSPAVSGNVGTPTSDVSVTVKLLRQAQVVATSPAATSDADGAWNATLPSHALSNPGDVLQVDYSGDGAPADAEYPFLFTIDEEIFNAFPVSASTATDGSSVSFYCQACTSPMIEVRVEYAAGGSAHLVALPTGANYTSRADLPTPVGAEDVVTYTATFIRNDSAGQQSHLDFTARAPLPGSGTPASCTGNLALATATCGPVPTGYYDITRVRAGSADVTQAASATYPGATIPAAFADLKPGDKLELRARDGDIVITSVELAGLRVDADQSSSPLGFPFFGGQTTKGGSCEPGTWLQQWFLFAVGTPCPASGVLPSGLSGTAQSLDDLSGGLTATTPPSMLNVSPLDGENVYGTSVVAFADVDQTAAPVALSFGPRGGAQVPASGNANSATGAVMSGIAAGTRYAATWVATSANGDTTALATRFNGQAGTSGTPGAPGATGATGSTGAAGANGATGATGATGAAGANGATGAAGATGARGAAGATGARGPQGPAGPAGAGISGVNVTCKLVKKSGAITGTKCKATIVRSSSRSRARVGLRLYRGSKVYAMGGTVLKKRSGSFGLVQRRKLTRGARYDMTIVLTEKKGTVKNAVGRVRVR